ncbi:MAG TPA: 4-hydroxy-tetrahydrodipicolinate synthase [Solirubrobacteraceae bacterium]
MALGAVLTAMVTPFDADGRVDEAAAVRLMHHLLDNGSDGLVIAGSTGEAAMLSDEEHLGLVELAVGEVGDRGSVVAATGSNDTRHAVALTEGATERGADATLSVTPYYVKPNRRGMLAHFGEVARATDKPVLLYNIPGRTATDMPNDLLAELAQIEHIDGIKQARSTDVELIDGLDLFYAGNDDMFCDVLEVGGAGGILVAAHIVGDEMRRMVDEPERRREIDDSLRDVYAVMNVTTNPIPLKAALNLLGHGVGGHRLPLVAADEAETAAVREVLERHGLLQGAAA